MMKKNTTEKEPYIVSINISSGGIPKSPVESARITVSGVEGDGHNHKKHYNILQAVCLQDIEKLEDLQKEGYPLSSGTTGENLTVRNLHVNDLPVGTILKFSSGVTLELSKKREPCYVLDAIHPQLKKDILGRCGFYAKVIQEGIATTEEKIEVIYPLL